MSAPIVPIPQPRPVPLLGNLPDIDADKGILGIMELAQQLGPIFRLELPGGDIVFVSSQELVDEVCDESRFDKALSGALLQVRDFAGDGLFTAVDRGGELGQGAPDPDARVRPGRAAPDVRRHGRHRRPAAAQVGAPGPERT